jgi:hypothetical protein
MLKDYNGQTYWLSGNISAFLPKSSKFPKWLNVAVGYGAEGMTGAYTNPATAPDGTPIPASERYRQFYLSIDVDFSRIPTNNKTLHTILCVVNVLKFPFPALEFNTRGEILFYPFYF